MANSDLQECIVSCMCTSLACTSLGWPDPSGERSACMHRLQLTATYCDGISLRIILFQLCVLWQVYLALLTYWAISKCRLQYLAVGICTSYLLDFLCTSPSIRWRDGLQGWPPTKQNPKWDRLAWCPARSWLASNSNTPPKGPKDQVQIQHLLQIFLLVS